jgi:hypothetical protein
VPDFNPYCSPAHLRVSLGNGAAADLILHSVDGLRQTPRGRGLDANPRSYDGVIEVPPGVRAPRLRDFVEGTLGGRRFTRTKLEATTGELTIDALDVTLHRAPSQPAPRRPHARHRRLSHTRHHRRR